MGWTWMSHYEPESKRQTMEWKYTDSPVNKRFRPQWEVKKANLLKHNRTQQYFFLEKSATVNNLFPIAKFLYKIQLIYQMNLYI